MIERPKPLPNSSEGVPIISWLPEGSADFLLGLIVGGVVAFCLLRLCGVIT